MAATGSFALMWAVGRLAEFPDWTVSPALEDPVQLAVADGLAVAAILLGTPAIIALALRYGRGRALSAFGAIVLSLAALGGLVAAGFDFVLIAKAQSDEILEALLYVERHEYNHTLGLALAYFGGGLGFVSLGIGLVRSGPALRRPGFVLSGAALVGFLVPLLAPLLAATLAWIAIRVVRTRSRRPGGVTPTIQAGPA